MRELIDLMKELLLIKEENNKVIGLTGFKKAAPVKKKKPVKKVTKEIKISDLMRRSSKFA